MFEKERFAADLFQSNRQIKPWPESYHLIKPAKTSNETKLALFSCQNQGEHKPYCFIKTESSLLRLFHYIHIVKI